MARPFRLETLLRVRRRQEDMCAESLAGVRRTIRTLERQRRDITDDQLHRLQQAASLTERGFDVSDIQRYFQLERHLARVAVEKDARIAELRTAEKEKREELEVASKQKRVVERLEERHDEAILNELNKLEQKHTDEVATNRAAMRRSHGNAP